MQISDLKEKVGWVLFEFPDGSKRVLRTTNNQELLAPFLPTRGDRNMFDIDKHKWIYIPTHSEGIKVSVSEEQPILEGIDKFVNQFI